MLKNYFKLAFRNIVKYKSYSAINILGLATGITLCLLILTYVNHELSYDSFHENSDRIVRVTMSDEDGEIAVTPSMVAPSLASIAPEIENWVRLYEPTRYSPAIIGVQNQKFQENSFLFADSSFFEVFTFQFLNGDANSALINPGALVLTESIARKLFGSLDVIGETVSTQIFNTETDFEVTGVIRDMPSNSHFSFDYIASLSSWSSWSQLNDSEIRSANFYTYLVLNSSESISPLQDKTNAFVNERIKEQRDVNLNLVPLSEIYLTSNAGAEIAPMGDIYRVYGFMLMGLVVLLIAIINYVNLSTARSSRRATEVGIRKALGAYRSQLIKQFYGESTLITLISVMISLILVELFNEEFFALMGKSIQFTLLNGYSVWILVAGIVVVTSLLAGSYPAILLSSFKPVTVLKGMINSSSSSSFLRKGLVISQFSISTFLIISTIVIYQQTDFVISTSLGFDKESVIVLPARDRYLAPKQDVLKSEILRQPGVMSATYMSNIPGKVFGGYGAQHTPGTDAISTQAGAADKDLVKTLGIELLAGDGFPESEGYTLEQGYVYLINETLAKRFGWTPEEALNQPFNVLGNREGEIVGVVKDFNFASLHDEVNPLALFINPDMHNYLLIKVAPNSTRESLTAIEGVWDELAPHRPFEFEFLDQQLDQLYEQEVQTRNLISLFSVLAIFIACLGLVGLSSFLIERRAKEIGIRKVLGASVANVVTLLTTDFLKLVSLGFIIGAPIAWYAMEQWLTGFAYRIEIGIAVFIICALLGIIIAFLTVSGQSVKAALTNPVNSLKSE
ncbi:MAG: ABC transporter permease [Balneolaceae bacterium]|nr:ABC transporter permease [Balneolaceae bacterium]MBO6544764.1 ABC transporter permease [Balneolaceae bacterium]MBO6646160.1 ABC transporter permease [Balneolaceae bacterium]